jgi:hypothetical protein
MANLNLSQFTEKTFVADADWTFVWDTAGAISKKVSRNNWLNSGTLTTSAPVTISQTWNAVAQTFKAFVVNAAGTSNANSAAGSLLADFQVGGASQFEVDKTGKLRMGATGVNTHGTRSAPALRFASNNCGFYTNAAGGYLNFAGSGTSPLVFAPQGLMFSAGASLQWTSGVNDPLDSSTIELALLRDGAANTLALRNGAAAQTFNVYGTYTSGSVYERLTLSAPSAANAIIGTNKGGSGGTARGLEFQTDGLTRAGITDAGLTVIGRGFTGLKVGCSDIAGNDAVVDIAGSGNATITGRAGGSYGWASGTIAGHSGRDTALFRHSAGVVEINNGTLGSFRDLRVRSVIQQPPASITPASNGDYVVEATNDTTLTFRLKGSDGTVRSATLTLAP